MASHSGEVAGTFARRLRWSVFMCAPLRSLTLPARKWHSLRLPSSGVGSYAFLSVVWTGIVRYDEEVSPISLSLAEDSHVPNFLHARRPDRRDRGRRR